MSCCPGTWRNQRRTASPPEPTAVKPKRPQPAADAYLKQTLLKAQAVASIPASATGTLLAEIYERLGIAEEMKAKTRAQPGPAQIVEAVVKGEADLAVFLTNVLTDPRLDMVGPFPAGIQQEVIYQAGVAANCKEPDVAKSFIVYLASPPGVAVIMSKGMTPA